MNIKINKQPKTSVRLDFTEKQISQIKEISLPFGEKTMSKKVMAILKDYFSMKYKQNKINRNYEKK
jgi:catabolite regulation protein CreA